MCRFALASLLAVLFPAIVFAGPTEYRVLFDVDDDVVTGCVVDGIAGIDQVLATEVASGDEGATVVRTYRRVCVAGAMSEPLETDNTAWPSSVDSAGTLTVETRVPRTAFGAEVPMRMRIAFAATQGSATQLLAHGAGGEPILFPDTAQGRRRAITIGDGRVMVLNGQLDDWNAIEAVAWRDGAETEPGFQFTRAWAFAHSLEEGHFYFAFRARVSGGEEPVANDDNYERGEGQTLRVPASSGILANDLEPNGGPLTATKVTDASHGTVTLDPDGSFEYSPSNEASVETDEFSYRASNGSASSNTARVTIDVNARPVVRGGTLTVAENAPNGTIVGAVDVLDEGPGSLSFTILSGNTSDAFAITPLANGDGRIVVANAVALDFELTPVFTLTVRATDALGLSGTGTITIEVANRNDAPVATSTAQTVAEDELLTVAAPGLLGLATDEDGDALTLSIVASPANGVVTIQPDGSFAYDSHPNFNGTDSFSWRAFDGTAYSNAVSVTITVTPVNDTPAFTSGGGVSSAEDKPFSAPWATGITAGPADESAQSLSFSIVSDDLSLFAVQPALTPGGVLTFTPAPDANGTVNVTVTLSDDGGGSANTSAAQHFTISVRETNDHPTANADSQTTAEDSALSIAAATFAANDSTGPANESAQTLTVTSVSAASVHGGTVSLTAGTITYTPPANYNGSDSFTYVVTDDGTTAGGADPRMATGTVSITVTEANDAPIAVDDAIATSEDTQIAFAAATLTTNDSPGPANESAQTLTVTAVDGASARGGTVTLVSGTITYTPPANAFGTDSFSYTVTDDGATGGALAPLSGTATIHVTIAPLNDVPVLIVTGAAVHTEAGAPTNLAPTAAIADIDDTVVESATIRITGNYAAEDVLSFADTAAITGSVSGDTLTLSGSDSLANYVAALQAVQYTNTFDVPSTLQRTITWTVNDGDGNSNTQTTTLDVVATNDAPVNAVPAGMTTAEDTPLVLAGSSAIAISDVDAAGDDVQATLTVTNGTAMVNPSATAALTALTGDGTSSIVLTGALAEINAALDGLTFSPAPDFTGVAQIGIVTDDLGNHPSGALTDSDSFTIAVSAVNDVPVLSVTAAASHAEGTAAPLADAVTISDLDDTHLESATIVIGANYAGAEDVLSFVDTPTITGSYSGGTLTLTGADTLANYVAALQAVQYTNTADTPSTLPRVVFWVVNDGNGISSPVATSLIVIPTNDAPVNHVPSGVTGSEDTPLVFTGSSAISISDADAAGGDVRTTVEFPFGKVMVNPAAAGMLTSVRGNGFNRVELTGAVDEINAALDGMTFTPQLNFNGPVTVQVVTEDLGRSPSGNLTDSDSFEISFAPVNDAPSLSVTSTATYTENQPPMILSSSAAYSDPDDTSLVSATVRVTGNYVAGEDVLSAAPWGGISQVFDPATGTLTLTGSTDMFAYLMSLITIRYTNTSDAPSTLTRTLTWTVNDGEADSSPFTTTIDVIAVNDGPSISAPANVVMDEDGVLPFTGASAITVADVDSGSEAIQVTIGNGAAFPGWTICVGATVPCHTTTFSIEGTVAEVNATLATMTFRPAPESSGSVVIPFTVDDRGHSGTGAAATASASMTVTVNVVNDAPVLAVTASGAQYVENSAAVFALVTASVTDVDDANIESAKITITNAEAGDTLHFTNTPTITGTFSGNTLTLTGTDVPGAYALALQSIRFSHTSEAPSSTQRILAWTVSDGDASSSVQMTAIDLVPVN